MQKHSRKFIRKLTAFLLGACLTGGLLSAASVSFAANDDGAFSQWKTDGWTEKKEDGIPVLKNTAGQSLNVLYLNGAATGDALSFDVRIDNSFGQADGNVGAAFKMADGGQYFFEYNAVKEVVRVRRLGADGSDERVCEDKPFALSVGEWYTFALEFSQNHLLWAIDGETVCELSDTGDDVFEDGTLYIQSYFADVTLRNIKTESASLSLVEQQDYDFEFSNAASVEKFTSENGSVSWSNGRLIYALDGADSSLTSPPISAKQGTAYSMLLPLRNTILIRMSNNTDATGVRLYYVTTNDPFYSDAKSLTLDVAPHSGDATYYFNLSACPKLSGYLYGFRLEPIGASEGTIEIEAVTFEREAALSESVGSLISCVADGTNVVVTGRLESDWAGRKVSLYETSPSNFALTLKSDELVASTTADGESFTITIPYEVENMTRLSSLFLLGVEDADGVSTRIGERFWIQNAEELSEGNPYSFTLPDYAVSVLDFGAVGDGFTNDNAAIQAAVDHVSEAGGGVVVLPGDDSFYGRRYVATNICLRDNIELRIETGAVLWQSPRAQDYDYDVAVGHDVNISGVNWTHAGSCHNYPLIYGANVKNVRVTGGGIIRMQDGGGECADGVSGGTIWTGCENKIHLVPLGFWRCENVEINDVHLRRVNNYHINFRTCENVYVHGVSMWEVACASGDGISATVGTKNVVIDQCFFYSNDDAVTICSTYNDPRGLAWWRANPKGDNCVDNVTVRHSYLIGGHGITFITWGTDNPNLEMQEIKNVEVYDCALGGGTSAVGAWPDNPYFGKTPYDGSETNDYSPVKGVRIHDNRYLGATSLDCIKATDVITDCGIHSATQFRYGDFERGLENRYKNYTSGLSNWSFLTEDGEVGRAVAETEEESKNHYGALYGSGFLCQGLWMSKGEHTFKADVRLLSGTASLTVRNAETGELIVERAIDATTEDFQTVEATFQMESGATAYLGVTHVGGEDEAVYIDKASVTSEAFKRETWFSESFDDAEELQLVNNGFTITGGAAEIETGATGALMLQTAKKYDEFDLHFRLRYDGASSDVDANVGVSLRRVDSNNQYDVHYNPLRRYLLVREYKNGAGTVLCQIDDFDLPEGEWVDMAFRVQNDVCLWYINGERIAEFSMEDGSASGIIALVAYNASCAYDDVVLARVGTTVITGEEEFLSEAGETDAATTESESAENADDGNIDEESSADGNSAADGNSVVPIAAGGALLLLLAAGVIVWIGKRKKKK